MSIVGPFNRLRRSLAVRLSLWFALLFAIGFSAIFALLYWSLGRQMEARDYEGLQLRLQQYANLYAVGGLAEMRARVAEDSQAPNVRSLFIRLVGSGGDALWGKIPPDWIEGDARRVAVPDGWGGWNARTIYQVKIPQDARRELTVVSTRLPDGRLLQVGRATDSREVVLEPLRRTFAWIGGVVVLVGFGAGVFAARRATRPLRDVVATAREIIATGSQDARVPTTGGNDEMAELVHQFNTMLDKNAGLLRTMREALDNVAHDLRTPLTRLRGTAELALTNPDGPDRVDALADCVEQADDVLRLLRTLTEISEAEAGMLQLSREEVDLAQIARSAVELYADSAEADGLTLKYSVSAPVLVFGDRTRLRQVAANLIDNAVKYTPEGGLVEVDVSTAASGAGLLRVRDSGPGVPEAEQSRVWDRLFRGDQSRTTKGLGLGLSMVRAVVQAHGGSVSVTNHATGGAVFLVELPRPEPTADEIVG